LAREIKFDDYNQLNFKKMDKLKEEGKVRKDEIKTEGQEFSNALKENDQKLEVTDLISLHDINS
jgi:hypothetical protein